MAENNFFLEYQGYCPICEKTATFTAHSQWLRSALRCGSCVNGSVPRERALALVLSETYPNWRDLDIYEVSPARRGISAKLGSEGRRYTASHYFADLARGASRDGYRNEDLQNLTFADESFDVIVSLDVMEHIPDPVAAVKEIWRVLKFGGAMICTFPIERTLIDATNFRVKVADDGSLEYIKDPVYHGNPVSAEGALVTVDYGYDIHKALAEWAAFDVRIYRFDDKTHGILGAYTEVIFCRKRS